MQYNGDTYDGLTLNSRNPLARFAHRNRLRRCIVLAEDLRCGGSVLDYGCGTGNFVEAIRKAGGLAFGYDPYVSVASARQGLVYRDFGQVVYRAPFDLVTAFEVLEHLTDVEREEFLHRVLTILAPTGRLLLSVPIEIGPALFIKELNRILFPPHRWEYRLGELLRAGILGWPGTRAPDIKRSHKGFDFRFALQSLRKAGFIVSIATFGPLPFRSWYGNSQAFLVAQYDAETKLTNKLSDK